MDKPFRGKKAVVVGGSGGIGKGIADALIAEGSVVTTIGRHKHPLANSCILDLDIPENRGIVLHAVSDADILCVVRGPFLQKPLHLTTEEEWVSTVLANLAFPGMLVSAALPHMCKVKWGRILLFGGTRTDAIRGFRTNPVYAAAKTGLASIVKSVALEYASLGVSCNALCPGFVDSEYIEEAQRKSLSAKIPDGVLISVQEITESALFMLKSTVHNGVVMPVDKGWAP